MLFAFELGSAWFSQLLQGREICCQPSLGGLGNYPPPLKERKVPTMNLQSTFCALAATAFLAVSAVESQAGHHHFRSRAQSSRGCCHVHHQPVQNACCGTSVRYSAPVTAMTSQGCCGANSHGYSGNSGYYNGQVVGGQQMMDANGSMHWNGPMSNGAYGSDGSIYDAPGYSSQQSSDYNYSNNPNGSINAGVNTNGGNTQFQGRTNANANVNTRNDGLRAGADVRSNNNAAGSNATVNRDVRANANGSGASLDSGGNLNAGGAGESAAGSLKTNAASNIDAGAATDL